jgi:hypothetical protein
MKHSTPSKLGENSSENHTGLKELDSFLEADKSWKDAENSSSILKKL